MADYTKHNILRIDPKTRAVTVLAHSDEMNQPNDVAITAEGMLFASDPNWEKSTGQIWRIEHDGRITRIASDMGTANGIEVSPDGKTLYVNETVQRKVWAFTLHPRRQYHGQETASSIPRLRLGRHALRCGRQSVRGALG